MDEPPVIHNVRITGFLDEFVAYLRLLDRSHDVETSPVEANGFALEQCEGRFIPTAMVVPLQHLAMTRARQRGTTTTTVYFSDLTTMPRYIARPLRWLRPIIPSADDFIVVCPCLRDELDDLLAQAADNPYKGHYISADDVFVDISVIPITADIEYRIVSVTGAPPSESMAGKMLPSLPISDIMCKWNALRVGDIVYVTCTSDGLDPIYRVVTDF